MQGLGFIECDYYLLLYSWIAQSAQKQIGEYAVLSKILKFQLLFLRVMKQKFSTFFFWTNNVTISHHFLRRNIQILLLWQCDLLFLLFFEFKVKKKTPHMLLSKLNWNVQEEIYI